MAERKLEIVFLGNAKPAQEAMQQLGQSAGGLEVKVSGLQGAFSKVSQVAGGFLAAQAIAKGPEVLSGLASSFTELELQAKKAAIVFGDELGSVHEWASENAAAMGLTKSQATNLATGLADLLVPMGMSREEAAKMSTETVGLAGALAEWSGGQKDASEVAEILTKAYLGETDGLKALGISISAADIQARLATKGQEGLTGAALEQARALAVQELIFEKSTDAQAAFTDGADSAARKQAEMRAKTEEAKEALARSLGPVIQQVTTLLARAAVPAFEGIGVAIGLLASGAKPAADALGWIVDNLDALQPFLLPMAGLIGGVAAVILASMVPAAIAWTAAEIAKTAAMIASAAAFLAANAPLIAIAAAVGLLVAGIVLLVQHWDTVTEKVPALGVALDTVKGVMTGFLDWLTGPFAEGVMSLPTTIENAVNTAIEFVQNNFGFLWDPWIKTPLEAIKIGVETYMGLVQTAFETAFGVIRGIFDVFAGLFTGDWDRMKEGLLTIATSLKDGAVKAVNEMITGIKELGGLAWEATQNVGSNLMDGLINGIGAVGGIAQDIASVVGNAIKSWINTNVIDRINAAVVFTVKIPNPFGSDPSFTVDPPDIPHLAQGGVVRRPTVALIGEAGPEAVVPLAKMRGGLGAGTTVTVHVHGPVYAESTRAAVRSLSSVGWGVDRALRARGVA